jgi:U3 small nucleolar RNA-associated protein 14
MARPRSSRAASKQPGSAAGKKRRSGDANGGGRPAKRRGEPKPRAADLYEAEDSDPDEVKNANRFDVGRALPCAQLLAPLLPHSVITASI